MPLLNRKASPSGSTRHTIAPTRSGGPSGGTISRLHRGSDLQLRFGSDLCAKRADVQGARQIAARSSMDDDGPGNTSSGVLPPVLLLSVHERDKWQLICQIKGAQ